MLAVQKRNPLSNSSGFTPILLAVGIAVSTLVITAVAKPQLFKDTFNKLSQQQNPVETPLPSPSESPSTSPTPSISATPSASPKPSISPKPTPSTTASPKPTQPAQTGVTTPPASGFASMTVNTERGSFKAGVVVLPIGAQMITDTANDSDCIDSCPTKSLADYVNHFQGSAGINGTYFCPNTYPECQSKKDAFDFPVYITRLGKWINQDKLFWNDRSMIYQDGSGMHYVQNANSYGGSPKAAITNYPGLLENGNVKVGGGLSEKQTTKGTKGGIGFNASKIFLVMAYGVDMLDFAHLFKSLGATHALNLDGGGSAALWYGGYMAGPGRGLPNAIIFK